MCGQIAILYTTKYLECSYDCNISSFRVHVCGWNSERNGNN